MGLILLITAIVGMALTIILLPFTFIWKWITFGWKDATKYLADIALAIDQAGNVYLRGPLNRWTTGRGVKRYYFGDEDDTISYVTAMNFYKKASNGFGRGIGKMLDFADKDHMKKAILNKYKRDLEALKRLEDASLVEVIEKGAEEKEVFVNYINHVNNQPR